VGFLIDTNVISELRKGQRCDANVAAWYKTVADDDLYSSALVLGEIRKGIEIARPPNPAPAGSTKLGP
jgi:toxin FitB